MVNQITGTIIEIGQEQVFPSKSGGSDFRKRQLVLDCSRYDQMTGEKLENYVSIEFTGKRLEELTQHSVGDYVTVSYVLQGRKYVKDNITKYFTNILGIKVESNQDYKAESYHAQEKIMAQPAPVQTNPQANYEDDKLPF